MIDKERSYVIYKTEFIKTSAGADCTVEKEFSALKFKSNKS